MKRWNNIRFWSHPLIWIKDKYKTGVNRPTSFIFAIIPGALGAIALVGDMFSIFSFERIETSPLFIVAIFLFVFGIINMLLVITNQRYSVRLERHEGTFEVLHKSVVEKFRDYHRKKSLL